MTTSLIRPRAVRFACLAACVLMLCTSCGTLRFNHAWHRVKESESAHAFEGRWTGTWKSEFNGHAGGLRCIVSAEDDGRFLAWFHSTYSGFLTFQYKTHFAVTDEEGRIHFRGEQDLGSLVGGVYQYEGTVEGDQFRATFRAENNDHGVFEMERVTREPLGSAPGP